jgi:hypothetical protein
MHRTNGLQPEARTWSILFSLTLTLLLASATSAGAASVKHIYELDGSFADSLGGPEMAPAGGTLESAGYAFGPAQGPSLSGAIDPDTYSIEMLFSIDDTAGYKRLLAFKALTVDLGLYNSDTAVNFYNRASSAGGVFAAGRPTHLVVTRDGATNLLAVYVDGVEQVAFVDDTDIATFTGADAIIHFLRDDSVAGGENPSGFLDRVRIYEGALTPDEVADLFAGGDPPDDTRPSLDVVAEQAVVEFRESAELDRGFATGEFRLTELSDGVDPLTEDVVVTIGSGSVTIPAGWFAELGGVATFEGTIDDSSVKVEIAGVGDAFEFDVELDGINLAESVNPVAVGVAIGDDFGSTSLLMQGRLHFDSPEPPVECPVVECPVTECPVLECPVVPEPTCEDDVEDDDDRAGPADGPLWRVWDWMKERVEKARAEWKRGDRKHSRKHRHWKQ